MKSENEYLGILKDLDRSNTRVQELEQDPKASSKNPLKEIDSVQRESCFVARSLLPKKKKVFTCHYCGKKGHIRPFCHELLRKLGKGCHFHDKGQSNLGIPTKTSPIPHSSFKVTRI